MTMMSPRPAGSAPAPAPPRELQVEVTGACNLSCRMCLVNYRPKIGRRSGALDPERLVAVLDELPGLEKLTLQGLGEPLLALGLLDLVTVAKERGLSVGFNTNAMLLTRPAAQRLVELGLDWLHVSLDGATAATYEAIRAGASFERVVANLRGLVAERAAAGARDPRIQLVFVAMRRNVRELPGLVTLAADVGVDGLWVQNLSHSFSDTEPAGAYAAIRAFAADEALGERPSPSARRAFAEAADRAAGLGLDLRLPRLDPAPVAAGPEDRPACDWPWRGAYVTHRGDVQPCCMVMGADRVRLGNVGERTFAEIWADEPYRRFRAGLTGEAELPDVCRGCSELRRTF